MRVCEREGICMKSWFVSRDVLFQERESSRVKCTCRAIAVCTCIKATAAASCRKQQFGSDRHFPFMNARDNE